MKIVISGGSGFIGKHLNTAFNRQGYETVILNRSLLAPQNADQLSQLLSTADVVINLSGASVNHRWTKAYKKEIYDSRILTTRALVTALNNLEQKNRLFVSASAVGAYSDKNTADENQSGYGSDFLATVCRDWEAEAKRISPEIRLVIPRFGVVLARDGGAFPEMLVPFKWGLGGTLGNGKQEFPWIHIEDLINAIVFIIENKECTGVVNVTAPDNITNGEFTRMLSRILKKPAFLTIPHFALRLLLGERAVMLLNGPHVYPAKLFDWGFPFRFQTLKSALSDLCK